MQGHAPTTTATSRSTPASTPNGVVSNGAGARHRRVHEVHAVEQRRPRSPSCSRDTGGYSVRLSAWTHDVLVIPALDDLAPKLVDVDRRHVTSLVVGPGTLVTGTCANPSGGCASRREGPAVRGRRAVDARHDRRATATSRARRFPGQREITVKVTPPAASGLAAPRSGRRVQPRAATLQIDYAASLATCDLGDNAGATQQRQPSEREGHVRRCAAGGRTIGRRRAQTRQRARRRHRRWQRRVAVDRSCRARRAVGGRRAGARSDFAVDARRHHDVRRRTRSTHLRLVDAHRHDEEHATTNARRRSRRGDADRRARARRCAPRRRDVRDERCVLADARGRWPLRRSLRRSAQARRQRSSRS